MELQNIFRAAKSAILAGCVVFCTSVALAQSDTEVRSKKLFDEARELAGQNRWTEACPLFQAAYELTPNGGAALSAADCYEKTERPKQALELYKFIVTDPNASKNAERVEYAKGRIAEIEKALAPPPPPTATASASAAPTSSAQEKSPKPVPNRIPAYAAFGVGGAGIVVGSIFGGLALANYNTVQEECPGTVCNPSLKETANTVTTQGWVSNIAFGVGIVGAAVGVVLLVTGKPTMNDTVSASANGIRIRF